jgi:hypothetical protein
MFGFTIASKREMAFFAAQIKELRDEKRLLMQTIEVERRRADAAVNALLVKTNSVAINPVKAPITEDQEEAMRQTSLDIFNDAEGLSDAEILERVQHDRTR